MVFLEPVVFFFVSLPKIQGELSQHLAWAISGLDCFSKILKENYFRTFLILLWLWFPLPYAYPNIPRCFSSATPGLDDLMSLTLIFSLSWWRFPLDIHFVLYFKRFWRSKKFNLWFVKLSKPYSFENFGRRALQPNLSGMYSCKSALVLFCTFLGIVFRARLFFKFMSLFFNLRCQGSCLYCNLLFQKFVNTRDQTLYQYSRTRRWRKFQKVKTI